MIDCIFCKIAKGEIPSNKLAETENVFAFMDIAPLSQGHCLIIPKTHAEKLHEVPYDALSEILVIAKKIATAAGFENYNVLQNNGSLAHQAVPHAHWHIIPKTNSNDGLGIRWEPLEGLDQDLVANKIRSNL